MSSRVKKVKDYSNFTTIFFVITHPKAFKAGFNFIKTVLIDFFFLQFGRKFGFTKIPIAKIDNKLDEKIPFTPEKIHAYLYFTSFWIRPLSMIIKKLGAKKALPIVVDFLNTIALTYKSASRVYKMCMTTTARPKYYKNFHFRLIHFWDPHYLCVPSLHIGVVSLVWSYYKNLFNSDKISDSEISATEKNDFLNELYDGAIEIAETVLYIKQHSVNCIPAALYMMTFLLKPYFTAEDGIHFLRDLFVKTDIPASDQKELKDYMYFIFERFLLVGITDDNWISPIRAWLKEYCTNTNQAEIANQIGRL